MSQAPALPWMPILMYHSIVASEHAAREKRPEVSAARLGGHIAMLARLAYLAVPLDLALSTPAPGEGRRYAITFDDAYRDNLELALPILEKFSVPAMFFVPTDYVGKTAVWNTWPAALLSDGELRSLRQAGVIIGSHSRSHRPLTDLSDRELENEVAGSKHQLEDIIGDEVRFFSYPHHAVDVRVMDAVRQAGYQGAVGGRSLPHERFHLQRIDGWRLGTSNLCLQALGIHRWVRAQPLPSPMRSLLRKIA
jgi:peptidoglycan/xylan/chitin deacetylase (PgdA/CDA1 family)